MKLTFDEDEIAEALRFYVGANHDVELGEIAFSFETGTMTLRADCSIEEEPETVEELVGGGDGEKAN